jgi:hypothetical protein
MPAVKEPRALLDRGPHVQRLLAELKVRRSELASVRTLVANQSQDTEPVVAVREVVRLRDLRVELSSVYKALAEAHHERALPRHTLADMAQWAAQDFCALVADFEAGEPV